MPLRFHDVSPLVEQDVISFDDCGQTVEHGVTSKVDLIQENPIAILDALDQSALDELENKSTTRLELLTPLSQVCYLAL